MYDNGTGTAHVVDGGRWTVDGDMAEGVSWAAPAKQTTTQHSRHYWEPWAVPQTQGMERRAGPVAVASLGGSRALRRLRTE